MRILDTVRQTESKVETELFKGCLEQIKRQSHYPLVIIKGSRSGCGFAAKMLFTNLLSIDRDSKGYVLREAEEISVINEDEHSVVLILDANGPTGNDMKRLDGWYETLKERMPMGYSDRGKPHIIMSLQDGHENKNHPILHKYSEYIVDAFQKRYRPADETKDKLTNAIMKQNNVWISPVKCGSQHQEYRKTGKLSIIDKETANGIVPLLGSTGCIGKLTAFFRSNLSQGLNFFRQPIPKYVQYFRELYNVGSPLFLVLLAVHAHGGQLGVGRVNQMRKLNEHAEKFWYSVDNINHLSKKKSRAIGQLFDSVELQLLYLFARQNGLLMHLGNNLQKCARQLNGTFLDEINDVYRFSNGHIYYSFLLVCCEVYPITLESCEDAFFFNFVKSRKDSLTKETDMFFVVDDNKLNSKTRAVMTRVKKEMMLRHIAKCMKLPFMDTCFFKLFVKYLKESPHLLWTVLTQLDSDPKEAYSCLYHGIAGPVESLKGVPRNVSEVIVLLEVWAKKRRKQKWREWMRSQMNESLIHAAELLNEQTVSLLIDKGADNHVAALEKAMDVRAASVIDIILEQGKLSKREWRNAALHALAILSSGLSSDQLLHDVLKAVLRKTDVNVAIDGNPPLVHRVVQENNVKMLSMLIEGDIINVPININITFDRETALTIATRLGFKDIVDILLQHNADQNVTDVTTRPIYIAASEGYGDVLKLLNADNLDIIYDVDSEGLIPLFHAVSNGQLDAVRAILLRPDVHIQTTDSKIQVQKTNSKGQTALHVASALGYKNIVHVLLEHEADVSLRDYDNETPLSLACRGKHMSVVRVILNQWNLNNYISDERAVMRAVQDGDTELVQLLNEYGFGVNFVNSEYGVPLLVAIQYGMHDMVLCILRIGGDPNIEQDGHRPVHVAAAKGDTKSFRILVEYKAHAAAITGVMGDTVIHVATEKTQIDFVKEVCQMTELIDRKNYSGETAVHAASKIGSTSLVRLLLQNGYKKSIPNKNGVVPIVLAREGRLRAIANKDKVNWNMFANCVKLLEEFKDC